MNKTLLIPLLVAGLILGLGGWYIYQRTGNSGADFELDKAKQEFIWDAEHITFEIENYFGKPFAAGLKSGDATRMKVLLSPEFQAEIHAENGFEETTVVGFQQKKWESTGEQPADADGLIAYFQNRLRDFDKVNRSKTRVLKIDSVDGSQTAWETELLITAHGVSKTGQPVKLSSHHHVQFEYDDDTEIHEGGTATSWQTVDMVVTIGQKPLMEEVTRKFGLGSFEIPDNWRMAVDKAEQLQFQVAVEDFDRDGDFDIAVATYDGIPFLLCQENGKYVDRSRDMGLLTWQPGGPSKSSLAGWIDFDNDGFPDLVLGQYLYRNMGGLRFKDITAETGFAAGFDSLGMSVADYNGDGWLDIYLSRSHTFGQKVDRAGWVGDDEAGAANTLWQNTGKGKFVDVTESANAGGGNRTTFTSSWFFYDDDHWPDLYLANDFAKNVVLRNKGDGTFEDISEASGAADFATSMGVATGDLDNDGTTEIYVANMYSKMGRRIISHVDASDYPKGIYPQIQGSCAGNRLYRQSDSGVYSDVTEIAGVNEVGWAFGPLLHDFDGDGLLDIYATTGFMSFERGKPDG